MQPPLETIDEDVATCSIRSVLRRHSRAELQRPFFDADRLCGRSTSRILLDAKSPLVAFVDENWRKLGYRGDTSGCQAIGGAILFLLSEAHRVEAIMRRLLLLVPTRCCVCDEQTVDPDQGVRWTSRGDSAPTLMCCDCLMSAAMYVHAKMHHAGRYADDDPERTSPL